jgi:hypothetical protein
VLVLSANVLFVMARSPDKIDQGGLRKGRSVEAELCEHASRTHFLEMT